MKHLNPKINVFATVAQSIFAAGCIVILFILVPMWQKADPADFLQWFTDNGKKVGMIMLPLEMAPLMLSLVSYIRTRRVSKTNGRFLLLTNVCNLVILIMFFVYFLPVNASFMQGSMTGVEVQEALRSWKLFHIIRTLLSLLAMVFSAMALTKEEARQSYFKHSV